MRADRVRVRLQEVAQTSETPSMHVGDMATSGQAKAQVETGEVEERPVGRAGAVERQSLQGQLVTPHSIAK